MTSTPDLDPKRLAELRSLRFIERKVGCLILGPPGVGKTHVAVGVAMDALRAGYLVRYTTLDDLVRGLRHADALGRLTSKLAQLQRPQLLILDEAGYLRLDAADANRVFQVLNRRYTRGSTIVTSNKTVAEWAATLRRRSARRRNPRRAVARRRDPRHQRPFYRLKGRLDTLQHIADAHKTAD
jgi:DNA replication protein DnaC